MNLFIKTLQGKTISLDIQDHETILDIKKRLAISEKVSTFNMRIFIDGKERQDTDVVHSLFEDPENESLFLVRNPDRLSIHRFVTMIAQAKRSTTINFFQKLPFEVLINIISKGVEKLSEKDIASIVFKDFDDAQKIHNEYQAKQAFMKG